MSEEIEMRRRRASYRAHHRGTKEMDVLVGRFADSHLAGFSPEALAQFERLIALPDPALQTWIFSGRGFEDGEFAGLIGAIRSFHGLADNSES